MDVIFSETISVRAFEIVTNSIRLKWWRVLNSSPAPHFGIKT